MSTEPMTTEELVAIGILAGASFHEHLGGLAQTDDENDAVVKAWAAIGEEDRIALCAAGGAILAAVARAEGQ